MPPWWLTYSHILSPASWFLCLSVCLSVCLYHQYVRLLAAVKAALKRRQDKKSQHLSAIADLDAKQSAYSKLLGVAGKEDQATNKLVQVERCREQVRRGHRNGVID